VSPWTLAVVSLHISTPFSIALLFNLGNVLIEPSVTVHRRQLPCVMGKKYNRERESSNDQLHSIALHAGIRPSTILLLFSAFSLPREYLLTFSNVFQALISLYFHPVLKSWSLNTYVICEPIKITSFFLASLILAKYLTNSSPYLSIDFRDNFINPSSIWN
jgi:hypothetical protein